MCRALFPQHQYETLEAPDVRAFAAEDPRAFLARFPEGAVLDEVQRVPDLLSYLQGIIDSDPVPGSLDPHGFAEPLSARNGQSVACRTDGGVQPPSPDEG